MYATLNCTSYRWDRSQVNKCENYKNNNSKEPKASSQRKDICIQQNRGILKMLSTSYAEVHSILNQLKHLHWLSII